MTDNIEVRPITHIEFTGNADTKAVALVMTDSSGETKGYVINPGTVRAFLAPMISLAATWSGDLELSVEGLGGTQNALAAKQVIFARGRDDTEAAIRVFLGKYLDFTFLLPLNALMNAFNAFARNVSAVRNPGPTN